MKLKEFINKAVSVAMCAMIIGTTVVSVNVKADTKVSMEAADALDTHIDDGVAAILEKDDFENPEDYQKYLESHPQLQKQQSRLAARASANKNVKAKATLKYKITGLPSTAAIQKTYIGSTYIYVIQRSGSNSYLSRCVINGTTATYQDHMYLKNFGHGQTLGGLNIIQNRTSGLHVRQMNHMISSGELRLEGYNMKQAERSIIQKFQDFPI